LHIIIDKKSSARIFESNGQVVNPRPGTVIDQVIVEKDGGNQNQKNSCFDFFMVSNNNPRTATALPVRYKVISNTSGLTKREIEEFTF